jgi:hypothetical protein
MGVTQEGKRLDSHLQEVCDKAAEAAGGRLRRLAEAEKAGQG